MCNKISVIFIQYYQSAISEKLRDSTVNNESNIEKINCSPIIGGDYRQVYMNYM